MKSREDVLRLLSTLKPHLQNEYGVSRVGIFGSYARDDQNPGSDVDILIDVDPSIGIRFVTMVDELESELGEPVEVVSSRALGTRAAEIISQDIVYV